MLGHRDHNLFGAHVCAAKRTHHMRKNDLTQSLSRKWKRFFYPCLPAVLNSSSWIFPQCQWTQCSACQSNGYFPWVCLTVKRRMFAFLRTERNSLNKMVIRCLNKGRVFLSSLPDICQYIGSCNGKNLCQHGNMESRQPCTPPLVEALAAFSVSKTIWIFHFYFFFQYYLFVLIRTIWSKWLLSVTDEQGVQRTRWIFLMGT